MTIQTWTVPIVNGDTYIIVHPAGLSFYDEPVEVITKANPADAFNADAVVYASSVTSSGELWSNFFSNTESLARVRQAVVVSASASGVATALAKRVPRRAVTVTAGGRRQIPNLNGGDITNADLPRSFNNTHDAAPIPLGVMVKVDKPSSENWLLDALIYGYIDSGVELYTNSFALATSSQVFWVAGDCCKGGPVSVTESYILVIGITDASIVQNSNRMRANNYKTLSATIAGGTPTLLGSLFVSPDYLFISNSASSTCNVSLGTCYGIDKTTTPFTYSYTDEFGSFFSGSAEAVNAVIGGTDEAIIYPLMRSGNPTANGYQKIATVTDSASVSTFLVAPIFATALGGYPSELAYDPILPPPFDGIRIIWSPTNMTDAVAYIRPFVAMRTARDIPPFTGMVPSLRFKPENSSSKSFAITNFFVSGMFPPISESRRTPYIWANVCQTSSAPVRNAIVARGSSFPSGNFKLGGSSSDFDWAWTRYDPVSNTFIPIMGYVIGYGPTAGEVTITVPPPAAGLNADEVYFLAVDVRFAGGAGRPSQPVFNPDFRILGAWPFDIIKTLFESDSGGEWVGNAGWIWPSDPAGPTISFSNEPIFSLSGNTVTLSTLRPVVTVTPDSKFNNLVVGAFANRLNIPSPSISIVYSNGESAFCPSLNVVNTAYVKGGMSPHAIPMVNLSSDWVWTNPASFDVYPSKAGDKNITVTLYYSAAISSVYTNSLFAYAVPRVITQTFTLP